MTTPLADYTDQVLNNAFDDSNDEMWDAIARVAGLIEEAHGDIEAECKEISKILEDLAKVETEPSIESETILGAVYTEISDAVGRIKDCLVHQ